MSIFPLFSVLVLPWTFLILVIPSFASILTATIDDSAGDSLNPGVQPVYSPSDAFSPNSNCDGCLARPDPGNAFDNSWHDTSQFGGASPHSVTLSFTGIGIDVFCILANTVPGAATNTNLVFTIDGTPYPPFSRDPDETTNYLYNQNVLSVNGLSQNAHTLVISTNNASGTLLLFDYARYRSVFYPFTLHVLIWNLVTRYQIPRLPP
ncbi:hypothetical protein B0H16DRAFT_1323216 [Mycena metata]|uniref:Uncharacterized protein n=1 Tax=Mycena metata TaxID=1033252 RepID=A0AAD7IGS7_9AGAR|nr:hypothetical protein B0H16DRAFT_1323216 [Mycena metata]